jgi:hypothetical protein
MKKTIAASVALTGVVLAPSAFAQVYVSGGYTAVQVDRIGGDVTLGAITGRLGYELNRNVAVEGEVSVGVKDDSYTEGGSTAEVKLDNQFGAFAVGKLPLSFGSLYARLGYADTEISTNGTTLGDGSGLAYGGGIEFNFTDKISGRLDYTDFDGSIGSLGVSGVLKF